MQTLQAARSTPFTITLPTLAEGEHNAGIVFDDAGRPTHQLILLPESEGFAWQAAMPHSKEQSSDESHAWYQRFLNATRGPQRPVPFPLDLELRDGFIYIHPRGRVTGAHS